MEKLTDNHIILVGQKIANVNHNIAYLIFVEVDKNTIKKGFEKEVNVKENEKICIKKIFENYVIISLPREGFIIFDYLKNKILYKYTCEYIIAMKIEIFNKNFIYCYTVETKDNEGKIVEEMNLKKYLIQKIIKRKKFDFSVEEKSKISLCPKNQINDIILINLNKELKSNIPSNLKCPCHILSTIFPILFDSKIGHPGILEAISYPVLPFESFWLKRNFIYFSSEVDPSIFLHIVINLFETLLHL